MAENVEHDYHLVDPSPWPLAASCAVLAMAIGAVLALHGTGWATYLFWGGLISVCYVSYEWWADVVRESHKGDHTPVVQIGLRYGMILFIASEVMFFAGWFWAYFNASLFPTDEIGHVWPPETIQTFDPWHLPFINTLILLLSGTTVTWAHHALIHGDRKGLRQGLVLTVILGFIFTCFQALEYSEAAFGLSSGIYGSTFFMATGFHGFHVIIGTIFLLVCLIRAYRGHFTQEKHFGFEAAAWYWHFVDVVWLFLFIIIYILGAGDNVHH